MELDQPTIEAMSSSGISFAAYLKVPWGRQTVFLDTANIKNYITDPEQFAADYFEVSKSQYLDWLGAEGEPRCGATTKNGHR